MDRVHISHWCNPSEDAATIRVRQLGDNSIEHPQLADRITLCIDVGYATTVHLRPTAAEARDLIAALQWALHAVEVAA